MSITVGSTGIVSEFFRGVFWGKVPYRTAFYRFYTAIQGEQVIRGVSGACWVGTVPKKYLTTHCLHILPWVGVSMNKHVRP